MEVSLRKLVLRNIKANFSASLFVSVVAEIKLGTFERKF
jgi:hypothetical protein